MILLRIELLPTLTCTNVRLSHRVRLSNSSVKVTRRVMYISYVSTCIFVQLYRLWYAPTRTTELLSIQFYIIYLWFLCWLYGNYCVESTDGCISFQLNVILWFTEWFSLIWLKINTFLLLHRNYQRIQNYHKGKRFFKLGVSKS